MSKKSAISKPFVLIAPTKVGNRNRKKYKKLTRGKIPLRVRNDIREYSYSLDGLNAFLRDLLCCKNVFYKKTGHRNGQLTYPMSLRNKVKEHYHFIRQTISQMFNIRVLNTNPI